MNAELKIEFLPDRTAIQRINPEIREGLVHAQQVAMPRAFRNAAEFCAKVIDDLKLKIPVPAELTTKPAIDIGDMSFSNLREFWLKLALDAGTPESGAAIHAYNLAQRTQLLRAFDDPEAVLDWTTSKVIEITDDLPKEAHDVELGKNPGDVLDPYILAATQILLYQNSFHQAIGATVAHKALMILEGLLGHLHETVLGSVRGNHRNPEPRGELREVLDAFDNPFPGVDVIQPPSASGIPLRLHQIKSKTGSMNSSGGARLAGQMRTLRMTYIGAEVYSHSLVGNTLRGHRSMGGMLRIEPNLIVLVGEAAFRMLTGSDNGAELLLRLYQNAFQRAAAETGYSIETMAAGITETFRLRAEGAGEGFLELLLHDVTRGEPGLLDSRTYPRRTR